MDGFQPFERGGVTITPMAVMLLNLPENLRHRPDHMMLAGIITQRQPKDLNLYLRLLVDELLRLRDDGFTFVHPKSKEQLRVHVKLLLTCSDYPAHGRVNSQHVQNHTHGCHKCDTSGEHTNQRTAAWSSTEAMKQLGKGEMATALPQPLTHQLYLERAARQKAILERAARAQGAQVSPWTPTNALRGTLTHPESGVFSINGKSQLVRLPGFDIVKDTCLDMMHANQCILGTHLIPLLKGERLKKYSAGEVDDGGGPPGSSPTS